MTDDELKALVAANARAIDRLAANADRTSAHFDRTGTRLDRLTNKVEANADAIRQLIQYQETEAREWRAGLDDAIKLTAEGISDLGDRLEAKFDALIDALTGLNARN